MFVGSDVKFATIGSGHVSVINRLHVMNESTWTPLYDGSCTIIKTSVKNLEATSNAVLKHSESVGPREALIYTYPGWYERITRPPR